MAVRWWTERKDGEGTEMKTNGGNREKWSIKNISGVKEHKSRFEDEGGMGLKLEWV